MKNPTEKKLVKRRAKYGAIIGYMCLTLFLLFFGLYAFLDNTLLIPFMIMSFIGFFGFWLIHTTNTLRIFRHKVEIKVKRQNFAVNKMYNELLNSELDKAIDTYNRINTNSYMTVQLKDMLYTALTFYALNKEEKSEKARKIIKDILDTNFK